MEKRKTFFTAILLIFIFSILPLYQVHAAVVIDAVSTGTSDAETSLTFSHTVGASGSNRLLLIGVSMNFGETLVRSATYGGNRLTSLGSKQGPENNGRVYILQLINPPTGTHDVVIDYTNGAMSQTVAGAISFIGVDQVVPTGIFASAAGTSSSVSVNVASATGEIVFDTFLFHDSSLATADAGQVERWNILNTNRAGASTEDGASSVTMSWTLRASNSWAIAGVSVKPVSPPPTFTQAAYRFLSNSDSQRAGSAIAERDTGVALRASGAKFRLRILLGVGVGNLISSGETFKLQFASKGKGRCGSPAGAYADVTTGTAISFFDNALSVLSDGAAFIASPDDPVDRGKVIINQTYEEANNFTNSAASIEAGEDGKWDFSLYDNGALVSTTYCFRVVKSDNSLLNTYTVYPEVTVAAGIRGGTEGTSPSGGGTPRGGGGQSGGTGGSNGSSGGGVPTEGEGKAGGEGATP